MHTIEALGGAAVRGSRLGPLQRTVGNAEGLTATSSTLLAVSELAGLTARLRDLWRISGFPSIDLFFDLLGCRRVFLIKRDSA